MATDLGKILLIDSKSNELENLLPFYGYEVVRVHSTLSAIEMLEAVQKFDLILLELDSHNQSGFETLKAIRSGNEFFDVPVIVISPFKDEAKLILTLKMGADMCVRKPFSLPALVARIEAVLRRTKYCLQMNKKTNNVTKNQKIDITSLTEREKDVLLLVAQGESNKSIAQKLVLSEVTVKSHLNSIFKKLNVTNRTQAVLVALESNIVEK